MSGEIDPPSRGITHVDSGIRYHVDYTVLGRRCSVGPYLTFDEAWEQSADVEGYEGISDVEIRMELL